MFRGSQDGLTGAFGDWVVCESARRRRMWDRNNVRGVSLGVRMMASRLLFGCPLDSPCCRQVKSTRHEMQYCRVATDCRHEDGSSRRHTV